MPERLENRAFSRVGAKEQREWCKFDHLLAADSFKIRYLKATQTHGNVRFICWLIVVSLLNGRRLSLAATIDSEVLSRLMQALDPS